MSSLISDIPDVIITSSDLALIQAYIAACEVEINGFAMIDYDPAHNRFIVDAPFILKQEATGTYVETDDQAQADFIVAEMQAGRDGSRMRFQWHSHVHMQAYFSPTDTDNIDRWLGDWLVSLVMNKRGEYQCRLDVFKPIRYSLELPLQVVLSPPPAAEQDRVRKEVASKVTRKGIFRSKPVEPREGLLAVGGFRDADDLIFFDMEEEMRG